MVSIFIDRLLNYLLCFSLGQPFNDERLNTKRLTTEETDIKKYENRQCANHILNISYERVNQTSDYSCQKHTLYLFGFITLNAP